MKVLETVLNFFLTLAQVIFPRKRKPSPSDRPCPPPQPPLPVPPLPLEGGETEVTLACIGGILSLLKNNQPPPHIPKNPDAPLPPTTSHPQPTGWESQATH